MAAMLECGIISTHSRAKAAGTKGINMEVTLKISTHSRAKAAGFELF